MIFKALKSSLCKDSSLTLLSQGGRTALQGGYFVNPRKDDSLRRMRRTQVNMNATIGAIFDRAEDAHYSLPDATAGEWVVLHTKSRCEKILSEEMVSQKISHFLPLVEKIKFYGRRKACVREPLFPGYVFLKGTLNDAYRAAKTKRVANILRVINQPQITWELHNLRLATSSGASLGPFPALKAGVRVEISSGPFRGIQGIVQERGPSERLLLQIETLGRAVSIELDGAILNPI